MLKIVPLRAGVGRGSPARASRAFGVSAFIAVAALTGCGRFGAPVAPERVAPKAVDELAATAADTGVTLTWTAPERDRRSKELTTLDGYEVYRKPIQTAADVTDDAIPFDLIKEIDDRSVAERERLREIARSEHKITRTIKAPPELRTHSVQDTGLVSGSTYLYKIVPINQGGIEGEVRQLVRVLFRGAASDVSIFSARSIESEDFSADEFIEDREEY